MAVTLCVPPRSGELCLPITFLLRHDSTVIELTSRHRVTGVEWDSEARAVAMIVEITDPATARPVDVRIDLVPPGTEPDATPTRSRLVGHVDRDGEPLDVYGTYLGVVADEN